MPRILSWHRREHFEYAGAAGGFIDRLGYPFCRGRILGHIEANHGQYSDERELFWATGACMMVRRDLFLEAGGFDELFFAHMEEIDLCWRMKNMGKRILFCPGSTVYHVGGGTLPNEHPYKLYLNFRNNLYTLYKNLPPGQRRKIMPARFFLDLIAALKYLLSGKPSGSLAILHAYGGFLKNRKICRENRKAWLELYPLGEHHEIYRGSILFEYFFKKRKTFTQLNFPTN